MAKTGFLDLPPELRCVIYRYLLKGDCNVGVWSKDPYRTVRGGAKLESSCKPNISTEILLVNKSVYAEAMPILYDSNVFRAQFPHEISCFVGGIGKKSIQHLRNIGFRRHRSERQLKYMLEGLKGAKRLATLSLPGDEVDRNGYEATYPGAADQNALADLLEWFLRGLKRLEQKDKASKSKNLVDIVAVNAQREWWESDDHWQRRENTVKTYEAELRVMVAEKLGSV